MIYKDQFLKYLTHERRYSVHTVTSYGLDLDQFESYYLSHLGLSSEVDVKHTHVRSWIVYMMRDNYTAKSIHRKISTIKGFYRFLKRIEVIDHNPAAKIQLPKIPKRLPQIVRQSEMERLIQHLSSEPCDSYGQARKLMILQLLYHTGVRRAELIGLKIGDINTAGKTLKVLGKGNKERLIPLSPALIEALQEYLKWRYDLLTAGSDHLFVTDRGTQLYPKFVYNVVRNSLNQVTHIDKKSPHVLRHTFATHLAGEGAELNAIKELMGHASLASTQVYMHNSIDRLKEVYQKAHPKGDK